MAYILCINERSKRPECEIGDVVAVYDFEPTATEREVFECIKVAKVKAEEIRDTLNGKSNPDRSSKFGTSGDQLTSDDKAVLKDSRTPVKEIRAKLSKFRSKIECRIGDEKGNLKADL